MSTKPTKAQRWPFNAEWARKDALKRAEEGVQRLAIARQNIEKMKLDLALAHIEYVRGLQLETMIILERAKVGEPDALATALRLLAAALDGKDVHEDARALIARFEVDE